MGYSCLRRLHLTPSLLVGLVFCFVLTAQAADLRAVSALKAVAYDAPSLEARKILIFSQGYPLEVIVNLGEWLKVRDATGALSWIEAKQTLQKRMVIATANTAVRQADNADAALVATLEKDVVVELVADNKNGWVKIKHANGVSGYVQNGQLWGAQ